MCVTIGHVALQWLTPALQCGIHLRFKVHVCFTSVKPDLTVESSTMLFWFLMLCVIIDH